MLDYWQLCGDRKGGGAEAPKAQVRRACEKATWPVAAKGQEPLLQKAGLGRALDGLVGAEEGLGRFGAEDSHSSLGGRFPTVLQWGQALGVLEGED